MLPAISSLRHWSCSCLIPSFSYLAFSSLFLPSAAGEPTWDNALFLSLWPRVIHFSPGCHCGAKGWTPTAKWECLTFKIIDTTGGHGEKKKGDLARFVRCLLPHIHSRAWHWICFLVCPRPTSPPDLPRSVDSGQRRPMAKLWLSGGGQLSKLWPQHSFSSTVLQRSLNKITPLINYWYSLMCPLQKTLYQTLFSLRTTDHVAREAWQ